MSQKIPATLVGVAIGDALGLPFEMKLSTEPNLQKWDGSSYLPTSNKWMTAEPGWVSDDTQMTLALARSITEEGSYDPAKVMDSYLSWFQSPTCRGMGGTVREAILTYLRTKNSLNCGVPGSLGNGTAMRASPIGLAFRKEIDAVARISDLDASLTHQSVEARHASMAIAIGVALLSLGAYTLSQVPKVVGTMLPHGLLKEVLSGQPYGLNDKTLPGYLRSLPGKAVTNDVAVVYGIVGSAPSFNRGLELAIRRGGDTDTIASMVGGLLGSHYGLADIPSNLLDPLENKEEILALNHACWKMGGS